MIEGTIRSTVARSRPIRGALLTLVALGVMTFLMLSSVPAQAATTFTVTETGDDEDINLSNARCDSSTTAGDQCTLRAAIEEANDTAGADIIDFDIGGTGSVKAISLASALPHLTDTVTIDGYTQAGASPNTLAEGNDAVLNVMLGGLGAGANVKGLVIEAPDCTIRGLVVKNFDGIGIEIVGAGATGNHIEGNFVGVDRNGTTDRGNDHGVFITDAANNTVGGDQPGMRNVVSGNERTGILAVGVGTADTRIEGNYVGTTAEGTGDLGNGLNGVGLAGAVYTTVGGTSEGTRNVISGNEGSGVYVSGTGATGNGVVGNYIGTTAEGTGDLGNTEDGVSITSGAFFNIVGGTVGGAGNRIAHNGADGVSVVDSVSHSSTGNQILSNSIYENGGHGIDLGDDSVTQNDAGDGDSGANRLQNFPLILSATRDSTTGDTTISGKLRSNPGQDFAIQCFLTDGTQGLGHGEGLLLLETTVASTNANGRVNFSCVSSSPTSGQTVSATATNVLTGDTSEFSRNVSVTTSP